MLRIETIVVTPFQQNARLLWDDVQNIGVAIDPGGEAERILRRVHDLKFSLTQIWLTHSHIDHCGGVAAVQRATGATLVAHPGESIMRREILSIARMYGLPEAGIEVCPEPQVEVRGGERLPLGSYEFHALFTPGHSPGHIAFHCATAGIVLSGDTLFQGGIGRTDLPGGNHEQLIASIVEKLLTLPDDTRVLSGHGPETTIGEERSYNPFLHDGILER